MPSAVYSRRNVISTRPPMERSSTLASVSSIGNSSITVQFDLNRSIDGAARDVQAALNAAASDLPTDLPTLPSFRKVNPAAFPIYIVALTSQTIPASEIYNVADTVIVQRCDTAESGSIVVALVDNVEVTLKRLRRRGASIALEPANQAYETRIFGPDRVKVQGRLVGLLRRY